jgi:glycosyltransferase involved in cell wall biosynthesis
VRVLHVSDRLSCRGGAHRYLLGVIAAQAAAQPGDELRLAVGRDDGQTDCACPVALVPGLDARVRDAAPVGPLGALAQAFRPDVVHLHTVVNPAVLHWARDRPAVVTVQDHRYFCPTRGKWTLDGRVCRAPLARATCAGCFEDRAYFEAIHALTEERLAALRGLRVTVLSRYMRRELLDAGVAGARVSVAPPFVHGLDPQAAPDGPPCVLFVGRLAEAKGVRDAVAAWRRAAVAPPLVFAGTGPLRAALEHDGFDVLGWLPASRLASAYRRAVAVLLPSRWQEPFGLAGLEALTLGTPVVAWDSGGVREWHPGAGLVAWGDVDALARALRAAVEERAPAPAPRPGFDRATALRRLAEAYTDARAGRHAGRPR